MLANIILLTLVATQTNNTNLDCPKELTISDALERVENTAVIVSLEKAQTVYTQQSRKLPLWTGGLSAGIEPGLRFLPANAKGAEGAIEIRHNFLGSFAALRRRDLAKSTSTLLGAQRDTQILSARMTLIQLWADALFMREKAELDRAAATAAATFRDTVKSAFELRGVRKIDVVEANAFAAKLKMLALQSQGTLLEAELDLSRGLGCSDARPVVALKEWSLDDSNRGTAGGTSNVLSQRRREQAIANVTRLSSENAGSVGLGLRVEKDSPGSGRGLLLLTYSFPLFEANHLERAEGKKQLALAEGASAEASREMRFLHEHLEHEVEHAQGISRVIEQELLPARRDVMAFHNEAFPLGQTTVQAALLAQMETLEAEREASLARSQVARAQLTRAVFLRAMKEAK